jgi:hypothetical protein
MITSALNSPSPINEMNQALSKQTQILQEMVTLV